MKPINPVFTSNCRMKIFCKVLNENFFAKFLGVYRRRKKFSEKNGKLAKCPTFLSILKFTSDYLRGLKRSKVFLSNKIIR